MSVTPGPWNLAPCVLNSFVSLVWKTDFPIFNGYHRILCYTMGDKIQQKAGSWVLSLALVVSNNSWWLYFFQFVRIWLSIEVSYIFRFVKVIAPSGAVRNHWSCWDLALTNENQPSCDECLLRMYTYSGVTLNGMLFSRAIKRNHLFNVFLRWKSDYDIFKTNIIW